MDQTLPVKTSKIKNAFQDLLRFTNSIILLGVGFSIGLTFVFVQWFFNHGKGFVPLANMFGMIFGVSN